MVNWNESRRKESLYDPLSSYLPRWNRYGSAFYRPFTPIEALISCPPFEDPEESISEQMELRDIIADALDELDEEDRWILDMLVVARLSLRFVGGILGIPKTTLARRRDRILDELKQTLAENPVVSQRLNHD